jgi:membrane protein
MNYRTVWSLLHQTFSDWNAHEAPRLGAALAFYTLLSLAPLVILLVAIAALIFGHSAAQSQLLGQVESMIGSQGSAAVKGMIEHSQEPGSGAFASIIGLITLLFGASGVFGELRDALNKMWNVQPINEVGVWLMIKERFFSFGMVLAVGFLLLVSLAISAALAVFGKFFSGLLPAPEFVLGALNFAVSLAGVAILFALIFRYVPDTRIPWREVWIGATVTALLFTVGKSIIGLYLGKAAVGSAYGAAGSLVVVIVWVYYSAMIFFFGAEFTHVLYAARHGGYRRGDPPSSIAKVTQLPNHT